MEPQIASEAIVAAWKIGAIFTSILTILGVISALVVQAFKADISEVLQWEHAHWVQFNIFVGMALMFLIGVSGLLWIDMPTAA